MRFSLGVNYWPAGSATAMWRQFDPGEIRDDFAHIAALGLDAVRFFVRWDEFQPTPTSTDAMMMERLETLVTLAGDAGLRAMPVLFCGHMNGVNFLPAWALDRTRPAGRYRTMTGDRQSPHAAGDLYRGVLLDAQLVFARAAAEQLREHPALGAWDIGHAFSAVRAPSHVKVTSGEHAQEPADERTLAEWSRRLTEALRDVAPVPVTAGTTSADVTRDHDVRLGSLCLPFAFASMQGGTVTSPFARNRLDPEAIPFLAMIAASFSYKPVLVTGFGNPTCPPEKFSPFERFTLPEEPPNVTISPDDTVFASYPCLTEDENAMWCTNVLERLHADGRLGAYWWCWTDYDPSLHGEPPFDEEPHAMTCGIVRAGGSEKRVARALAAFAEQERSVVPAADMPMIASTYYYRTLPDATETLYDAFLGFVENRRRA